MGIRLTPIGRALAAGATGLTIPVAALPGAPAGSFVGVAVAAYGDLPPASVADSAGNAYSDAGVVANGASPSCDLFYCWNCAALAFGGEVSVEYAAPATFAAAAFWASGVGFLSDPRDAAAQAWATGDSQSPSAALAAAPARVSSLVVAVLAVDAYAAQDETTPGTWRRVPAAAPLWLSFTVRSGLQTYAPTLYPAAPWALGLYCFSPDAAVATFRADDMAAPGLRADRMVPSA